MCDFVESRDLIVLVRNLPTRTLEILKSVVATSEAQVSDKLVKNHPFGRLGKELPSILSPWVVDSLEIPSYLERVVHSDILNVIKLHVATEKAQTLCNKQNDDGSCLEEIKTLQTQTLMNPSYKMELFLALETITKKGLSKVLLTAYSKLLPTFAEKYSEDSLRNESLRIFDFITSLATATKWYPLDVLFKGDILRFVLVPVAEYSGFAPDLYARRIERQCNRTDIDAVFVVAIGLINRTVAKAATDSFYANHSNEFTFGKKDGYTVWSCHGNKAQGTTILITRNKC